MDHPTSDDYLIEAKEILLDVSIQTHTPLQILNVLDNQLEPKITQLRESVISDLRTEAASRRNRHQMMRGVARPPPPPPPPPERGQKRKDLETEPSTHSDTLYRQEKMKGLALPPPPSPPRRSEPPTYSDTISGEGSKLPCDGLPWKRPSRWVSDNIRKRFYKCKADGCPATKYMFDSAITPGKYDVTYRHYHTCGINMFGIKPKTRAQVQTFIAPPDLQGSSSTAGPPVQTPSVQTTHQGSSSTYRTCGINMFGIQPRTGAQVQTFIAPPDLQGGSTTTGPPVQTPSVQTTHQGSSSTTAAPVQRPFVQTDLQGSSNTAGAPVQRSSAQTTHQSSFGLASTAINGSMLGIHHQGSTRAPLQRPFFQTTHQSNNTPAFNQGRFGLASTAINGSMLGIHHQGSTRAPLQRPFFQTTHQGSSSTNASLEFANYQADMYGGFGDDDDETDWNELLSFDFEDQPEEAAAPLEGEMLDDNLAGNNTP